MLFQVTDIEFDFDLGCDVDLDDYIGTFWEADDGDDLIEAVSYTHLTLPTILRV